MELWRCCTRPNHLIHAAPFAHNPLCASHHLLAADLFPPTAFEFEYQHKHFHYFEDI